MLLIQELNRDNLRPLLFRCHSKFHQRRLPLAFEDEHLLPVRRNVHVFGMDLNLKFNLFVVGWKFDRSAFEAFRNFGLKSGFDYVSLLQIEWLAFFVISDSRDGVGFGWRRLNIWKYLVFDFFPWPFLRIPTHVWR